MTTVRVPPNVSSVTFVTSGVKSPDGNLLISGLTAAEATDVTSPYSWGPGGFPEVLTNLSTGAMDMFVPASITSITINGNVKAVSGGKITAVVAADASAFIAGSRRRGSPFELFQG